MQCRAWRLLIHQGILQPLWWCHNLVQKMWPEAYHKNVTSLRNRFLGATFILKRMITKFIKCSIYNIYIVIICQFLYLNFAMCVSRYGIMYNQRENQEFSSLWFSYSHLLSPLKNWEREKKIMITTIIIIIIIKVAILIIICRKFHVLKPKIWSEHKGEMYSIKFLRSQKQLEWYAK